MKLVADTHVHVYPGIDRDRLWSAAARALPQPFAGNPDADLRRMLFLTESRENRVWDSLPQHRPGSPWRFTPADEAGAGVLDHSEEGELWIFNGRQIVTRERIEWLALTLTATIEDGLPAQETLERIRQEQAIPVLSWSPGKWLGKRGACIATMLRTCPPEAFLIGDIRLRPRELPEPALMRIARNAGFRILAGSDPLPFPGDEVQVGRYATVLDAPFDPRRPVTSARAALQDPRIRMEAVGTRNSLCAAAVRMFRHAQAGRKRNP